MFAEHSSIQFLPAFNKESIELPGGGKKLLFNGVSYMRKANKEKRIRWECFERRAYDWVTASG